MYTSLVNGEADGHPGTGDRGLAYGDGLFETLVVSEGRPRFWQAHMDRLADGCRRLHIMMPPQETLLQEALAVAHGQTRCVVKIILSRSTGQRGYRPVLDAPPNRVVSSHPYPGGMKSLALKGVEARTLDLRLSKQLALGGIKHLNRLEMVMAAAELAGQPELEGILLDQDDYVISTLSSNLFMVSGNNLLTPRMDRCGVRGVARALLLRGFKSRCELRRIHRKLLAEADEVFMCNAVRGIIPITHIDGKEFGAGTVTRQMQDWFREKARQA